MVFGFAELHAPPPPVHAPAGSDKTGAELVVLTAWVPEHPVPNVGAPQVYVRFAAATDGPPEGEKSALAWTVMDPLPVEVVTRAR